MSAAGLSADAPLPAPAGSRHSTIVRDLDGETDYGFAIAAVDEAGNRGEYSPIATARTGGYPPGAIEDLRAVAAAPGAVEIRFTAPADDGHRAESGPVAGYDVRWSRRPITGADWPAATRAETGAIPVAPGAAQVIVLDGLPDAGGFAGATPVADLPPPSAAGLSDGLVVRGLPSEATAWFAPVAHDDVGNPSPLSNVASGETAPVPPARVVDLAVRRSGDAVELTWTAPGADGDAGRASAYEVFARPSVFSRAEGLEPSPGAPLPGPAGSAETFRVTGLAADQTWFFALRAVDEKGYAGGALARGPDPPPRRDAAGSVRRGRDADRRGSRAASPELHRAGR